MSFLTPIILVYSLLLDDNNYLIWSRNVWRGSSSKGNTGFVTDELSRPRNDPMAIAPSLKKSVELLHMFHLAVNFGLNLKGCLGKITVLGSFSFEET